MPRKRGFTLVELIVVILIVGIISTVAVPIMNNMIKKAQSAEGVAILGTLFTAMKLYHLEHGSDTDELSDLDPSWHVLSDIAGKYYGSMIGRAYDWDPKDGSMIVSTMRLDGQPGTASEGEWVEMDRDGTIRKSTDGDTSKALSLWL